ncbi:lysophospholipid acyltransferase family protein [Pseudotenacibaculum sp. MALMAid0570]|uniref:lysophospholipid acyltransferase family protein n=1 Tax=Pseudotenacibaculum sp. MALMAid0570 TaxID=3143938 RepID=UPI0032DEB5E0
MKIISYLLSLIFGVVFFLILLIFHPLQWVGLKFGYKSHKNIVDIMNWCLIQALLILGNRINFVKHYPIPENTTIIFAANHQGTFDIPPMIWYLRKHHPKFVSKIELGKGIPSVSFNLRHGGAALINRKDPNQALKELENFGKRIHNNCWSAAIFPEGTRSRNGVPKKFSVNGLKMMIKYNPEAYIVPISINNSWKVFRYGSFPLGIFNKITLESHQPIPLKDANIAQVLTQTEKVIKDHINL